MWTPLSPFHGNTFHRDRTCVKFTVLMIAPGLYIRKEMKTLAGELSEGMGGLSPVPDRGPGGSPGASRPADVTVHLRDRGDGWCHMEMCGEGKGTSLVMEFVTGHESIGDVLVWDARHDQQEYGYSLFRKGRLQEQLSVKGPLMDAVSFVSNLRRVDPKDLINGLDFSLRAIESFGVSVEEGPAPGGEKITLEFFLPPPIPFFKRLLGSLSRKE